MAEIPENENLQAPFTIVNHKNMTSQTRAALIPLFQRNMPNYAALTDCAC